MMAPTPSLKPLYKTSQLTYPENSLPFLNNIVRKLIEKVLGLDRLEGA